MKTPRGASNRDPGYGGNKCPNKSKKNCNMPMPTPRTPTPISVPSSERQMFDKVTMRLRHRHLFLQHIEKHQRRGGTHILGGTLPTLYIIAHQGLSSHFCAVPGEPL